MITSAAETPSPLWISVGMPRPLSTTVADPSAFKRHLDLVAVAGQRLVDGVVDHLVDHVVQARAVVGVADIHARPLAHGIEALQDLDGLRTIVGGSGCFSFWGSFHWVLAGQFLCLFCRLGRRKPVPDQALILPRFTAKIWACDAMEAKIDRSVPVIQAWAFRSRISSKGPLCGRDRDGPPPRRAGPGGGAGKLADQPRLGEHEAEQKRLLLARGAVAGRRIVGAVKHY